MFPGVAGKRKRGDQPLFRQASYKFGLGDRTPLVSEWKHFLNDRQNRDGVFSVLCQYVRQERAAICLKESNGQELTWWENSVKNLRLRIDGEPVLSLDYSSTTGDKSWHTEPGVVEVPEEDNGLGEGELQALHHAYIPCLP